MTVLENVTEGLTLITGTLFPDMIEIVSSPPIVYLVGLMLAGSVLFMIKKAMTRR